MNNTESNFEVTNRFGDTIYVSVTWPASSMSKPLSAEARATLPLVVLLHGFKGFRNWGFFPLTAQHLADAEMLVIRIDFSKNGMQGTADRVVSPDDFATNTISRELDDIADVLAYVRTSTDEMATRIRNFWNGLLHFVGHSRGGGLAQVAGVEHRANKVVVWNSVGAWVRWTPRQRIAWMASGMVEVENTRTGQKLQMNSTYLLDIETHSERQSLVHACRTLSDRLLLIHAEHDLTVPLKEIHALLRTADRSAVLSVITNTTHTFGITHPLDHVTPAFSAVLRQTEIFLTT